MKPEKDVVVTRPLVIETIRGMRGFIRDRTGLTVGFVPTLGALHNGHSSLIRQARCDCRAVVVSIFVNPLQFGESEDFSSYPRQLEKDVRTAQAAGADVIFAPTVEEMYPEPVVARVTVGRLGEVLCGRYRPGHFAGVATVVAKFLNIVRPDKAYFGIKDYQQLIIVERLVKDLNVDVDIVAMPTIRDRDGLALSSRNVYLSPGERESALALPAALSAAKQLIDRGERRADKVIEAVKEMIAAAPGLKLEYFSICRTRSLVAVEEIEAGEYLLVSAVLIGGTRLIDNLVVKV